MKTKSYIATR